MASTSDVTLGTLIADTLRLLYRESERPIAVTMGAANLANSADTSCELASSDDWDAVSVGDRLEYGTETMRVTAKSADPTPVFTVARAQHDTPNAGTVAAGETLLLEPTWSRYDIERTLVRALAGSIRSTIPFRSTQTVYRTADKGWAGLDAATEKVLEVFLVTDITGQRQWLDSWDFDPTFPTALETSGKALVHIPAGLSTSTPLYVSYESAYQWYNGADDLALDPNTPADEADYVRLLAGMEDVPSLYAASWLVTGRELTRLELDQVEEWNQEAAIRQGLNVRMVRELWGQYYRRVDDVRRDHPIRRIKRYRRRVRY